MTEAERRSKAVKERRAPRAPQDPDLERRKIEERTTEQWIDEGSVRREASDAARRARTAESSQPHPRRAPKPLDPEVAAETLRTIAGDVRHLGAQIGVTLVLHTWGSAMTHHPHVHGIVPGGGLSAAGERWVACRPGFFLPVRVLSRLYRRLFIEKLIAAHRADKLSFFSDLADTVGGATAAFGSMGLALIALTGPYGMVLAGAWRAVAPLKGSKMWRGMIAPPLPTKGSAQPGVTSLKLTLTVRSSSASTLAICL